MVPGDVYRHAATKLLGKFRFYSFSQLRPLHVRHLN